MIIDQLLLFMNTIKESLLFIYMSEHLMAQRCKPAHLQPITMVNELQYSLEITISLSMTARKPHSSQYQLFSMFTVHSSGHGVTRTPYLIVLYEFESVIPRQNILW